MIHLSALLGRPSVDVSNAASGGKVTGISLAGNRIAVIAIGGRQVDAAAVRAFDGDVLTYDGAGLSEPPPPAVDRPAAPGDPRGARVLDLHGDRLGTLTDLAITGDGFVEELMLDGGRSVPGARLQVIGSYAAIVDNEAAAP